MTEDKNNMYLPKSSEVSLETRYPYIKKSDLKDDGDTGSQVSKIEKQYKDHLDQINGLECISEETGVVEQTTTSGNTFEVYSEL